MKTPVSHISYGPVVITGGNHIGLIGYYDDDDMDDDDVVKPIVYFGDMLISSGYYFIPFEHIASVTTDDLMRRREKIFHMLSLKIDSVDIEERAELLEEFLYIETTLIDRMFVARLTKTKNRKTIFISHSSKDKQLATSLAVDLASAGHNPWLDEWAIRAGESIPKKIAEGIEKCDFMVLVLSQNSVKSRWVENEWHAKYWNEVEAGKIALIPALYKDCEIPSLLKTKKYADFRSDYNDGFETLLVAINSAQGKRRRKRGTKRK